MNKQAQENSSLAAFIMEKLAQEFNPQVSTPAAAVNVASAPVPNKIQQDNAVMTAQDDAKVQGIVPGGGVTLINLAKHLADSNMSAKPAKAITPENLSAQSLGAIMAEPATSILFEALCQPFKQLMLNAGREPAALIEKIFSAKDGFGYDVSLPYGEPIDMVKNGIVDPARVTKEAILNAVSIAGTSMTMGALVVEVPEPKAAPAPDMGGMGM
jgi:chaperonin GroEL